MKSTYTRLCPECGEATNYCEKYDVYFCLVCDLWLEGKCKDPDCEFCTARPDKPSEVTV